MKWKLNWIYRASYTYIPVEHAVHMLYLYVCSVNAWACVSSTFHCAKRGELKDERTYALLWRIFYYFRWIRDLCKLGLYWMRNMGELVDLRYSFVSMLYSQFNPKNFHFCIVALKFLQVFFFFGQVCIDCWAMRMINEHDWTFIIEHPRLLSNQLTIPASHSQPLLFE